MTKSFDVFVRTINPDKLTESDAIKEAACNYLKIEVKRLEDLLVGKIDTRIFYNVSADEANQHQANLVKIGLICVSKPAVANLSLNLAPIAEEIFTCPKCEHEMPMERGKPPIQCTNEKCGIAIGKYLEKLERQREEDKIREELLRAEKSQGLLKKQQMEKDAEKKRQEDLKKKVMKEMGWPWKKKKKVILTASVPSVVLLLSLVGYLWWDANKSPEVVGVDGKQLTKNEPVGQSAKSAVEKINDMLGSLGLDTGKITGASSPKQNAVTLANVPVEPTMSPEQATAFTTALLAASKNDLGWDLFLSHRMDDLIAANTFVEAYTVAKYIVDTESYITAMGRLLSVAYSTSNTNLVKKILSALEVRIALLPIDNQAGYLAQAGFEQLRATGLDSLLVRANAMMKGLSKPESQLTASLRLGVYYAKLGNGDMANGYFGTINTLLDKVSNVANTQALIRIAIAKAYYEVNNASVAKQWLSSVNNLLTEIDTDTLKELVKSYAFIDSYQTAIELTTKKEQQSEFLYNAVQASLKANLANNALAITKAIKNPTYKALAYDVLASYDSNKEVDFLDSAEKLITTIAGTADKTIVVSQLAQHYARLANLQKTNEQLHYSSEINSRRASQLFTVAEQQIVAIPPSSIHKDEIIGSIATNYIRALQLESAKNLLTAIQSSSIKADITAKISQLNEIAEFLK